MLIISVNHLLCDRALLSSAPSTLLLGLLFGSLLGPIRSLLPPLLCIGSAIARDTHAQQLVIVMIKKIAYLMRLKVCDLAKFVKIDLVKVFFLKRF